MKEKIRIMEDLVEDKTDKYYALNYYRLTISDTTGKITDEIAEDFFIAFQNGFLDVSVSDMKKKFKRLKIQEIYEGTTAKVIVTKRALWKK